MPVFIKSSEPFDFVFKADVILLILVQNEFISLLLWHYDYDDDDDYYFIIGFCDVKSCNISKSLPRTM